MAFCKIDLNFAYLNLAKTFTFKRIFTIDIIIVIDVRHSQDRKKRVMVQTNRRKIPS